MSKRYNLVCGVHNGLEILLIALIFLSRNSLPWASPTLSVVGFSISAFGLFLLLYSGIHLMRANRQQVLATSGPYGLVRHPYYLGAIVLILGLALGLGSLWGILGNLFLLIPMAVYVARMEEEALAGLLGEQWQAYADRTHFMFPLIY